MTRTSSSDEKLFCLQLSQSWERSDLCHTGSTLRGVYIQVPIKVSMRSLEEWQFFIKPQKPSLCVLAHYRNLHARSHHLLPPRGGETLTAQGHDTHPAAKTGRAKHVPEGRRALKRPRRDLGAGEMGQGCCQLAGAVMWPPQAMQLVVPLPA